MTASIPRTAWLAAVLLIAACGKATLPPEPLRPVLTSRVGASLGGAEPSYAGEVRARFDSALAFRVAGKIVERRVDAGALVKAGDVLARLDPADSALSLAAAKAQFDLAAADLRRYRELREKNFVSQAALEARETAFAAARAQADLARNQSAYTVLRADQAGVVALVAGEVGQVVAAGQTVLRVARTDALDVAVSIPETAIGALRAAKGPQGAQVTLWADATASYRGVLREIAPIADAQTRTYAARVAIDQPDARIALGMTANVSFAAADSGKAQLAVPLSAIFQREGEPALWVVGADETVSLRPVTVTAYTETAALLASGVERGARIVIAGVHKLSAGEKIRAVDAAAPSR